MSYRALSVNAQRTINKVGSSTPCNPLILNVLCNRAVAGGHWPFVQPQQATGQCHDSQLSTTSPIVGAVAQNWCSGHELLLATWELDIVVIVKISR